MKKTLLFVMSVFFCLSLFSQKDTSSIASTRLKQDLPAKAATATVNIYPVPVRESYFNIKTDQDISSIRITNIIGQVIYKVQYNSPQMLSTIYLDNPRRGMYLVAIVFSDGSRIVKKIMIEPSE
ncbi:MAG: T9SS type A sorting domain-containing protein [Bacteroidales bacterium]|jgi:2-keto-4-pentenoate hydratase|nr:T9SS type A sorting domain-containing protein [Bacteroidales bacterium]